MNLIIIDYGMGNLRSVANAFEALGCAAMISNNPPDLQTAKGIVLPGVGAFGDGMKNLQDVGWIDALEREVIQQRKPFLGICLGMQLLATTSTEHGLHKGLNWIPGIVTRIPSEDLNIRVPHIGWNDVRFINKEGLYAGLGDSQVFYFVHSYMLVPENPAIIGGVCSYGIDFPASVECDNIFATQFHPEKSHKAGLAVLKNFLNQLDRS
jgi:imidazole glycerol-phosphate synthase subunit HisH